MNTKNKASYLLSTHWDREFYSNLEQYRYRLATLFDELLEGWESGELEGPLYLDGQYVPVEDYLEVRPENRERILAHIACEDIILGPWYTMPDLFIVSGESLIRNIEMGMAETRRVEGDPSRVLNCCDTFGFPGQLPQVGKGFGLEMVLLWRGSNRKDERNLIWEGVDGSKIPVYRFGINSYWGYAVHVRRVHEQDHRLDDNNFPKLLEEYFNFESKRSDAGNVLLFDGMDHGRWDRKAYQSLKEYRRTHPEMTIEHVGADAYARAALENVDHWNSRMQGELREPGYAAEGDEKQSVLQGTLSFRREVKDLNHRCETGLIEVAEPLYALARACTPITGRSGFLSLAWKALLQNHAHDTICGSVIDESMPDIYQRYHRAREIAGLVSTESLEQLAPRVTSVPEDEWEMAAVIHHTGLKDESGVQRLQFWIPSKWKDGDSGEFPEMVVRQGKSEAPVKVLSVCPFTRRRHYDAICKEPRVGTGFMVDALVEVALPAMGVAGVHIRRIGSTVLPEAPSGRVIENELLEVSVNGHGAVQLLDRRSGEVYPGLFQFISEADKGSPFHFHPDGDGRPVAAELKDCQLVHESSLGSVMKLHYSMQLEEDRLDESSSTVTLDAEVELLLKNDSDRLEVGICLRNWSQHHRVTLGFPTGVGGNNWVTGNAFDAVERNCTERDDLGQLVEPWHHTAPLNGWIAAQDDSRGLAIIAPDVNEGKLGADPDRTLSLVLLRNGNAFKFATKGLESAHDFGEHHYRMAIRPLSKLIGPSDLFEEARGVAAGCQTHTLEAVDFLNLPQSREIHADDQGLFSIEGPVALSSCRMNGSDLEVRLFNPSSAAAPAVLRPAESMKAFKRVATTRMDGQVLSEWSALTGFLELELRPKGILTLRFRKDEKERSC